MRSASLGLFKQRKRGNRKNKKREIKKGKYAIYDDLGY
jgi:hypothetical protein